MDEICDFIKNLLPITIAISFPLMIIVMPITLTYASHEFSVYRMQQIGLYGIAESCNGISFSSERKNMKTWLSTRHCILIRLKDLTAETYLRIGNNAGALLIVLPKEINSLQNSDLMKMVEIENIIYTRNIEIPVYFVRWQNELLHIMNDMELMLPGGNNNNEQPSTLTVLWNSIFAMGYHLTIVAPKPQLASHACIPVLQGKLQGRESNRKPRSIILVAHYDSNSVVPQLSFGADSNGSGVAALLELARIFSKFYSDFRSHPWYDIIFVLSGGGKINYQGTKNWLEDQLDSSKPGSLISSSKNVAFAVCMDSLSSEENGLHVHVSKPPKSGTAMAAFVQMLNRTAQGTVKLVHKKINLSDNQLAWEHERFSLKRLPAFTLSSLETHKHWKRNSMFDVRGTTDDGVLYNNVEYLSETIFNFMYNNSKVDSLLGHNVQRDSLQAWLDQLAAHPRHIQMLGNKHNPFIASLYNSFNSYLRNATLSCTPPDKGDSEYEFYEVTNAAIHVYSVKPAIFDLVLTFAIIAYLSVIYLGIQKFPLLYSSLSVLCTVKKKKEL